MRMLSPHDVYLLREGTHAALYRKLGCHMAGEAGGKAGSRGAHFSVWAPNAREVSVVGEWNGWRTDADPMHPRGDGSGVWEASVPQVAQGQAYKYRIVSARDGAVADKADPFAFHAEVPPAQASRAWRLDYDWNDAQWMHARAGRNGLGAPHCIYEVHLGSWRRGADGALPSFAGIAEPLAQYAAAHGFTHVQLMPITEHPFYGSWGYQTTGYFAPSARYGTPQDFMRFVDVMHRHGLGVILDWVPSHFPSDAHGLAMFDGTRLYEHADPRQGLHPEWGSLIFNYGRHEVRAFLISSALYWLDVYHLDGLRVDAVASMLYLDYGRKPDEWIPNPYGGRENLEAVHFLRELNTAVYRHHPDVQMIAEESTSWPAVSRPAAAGGLGFGMKWNMGWMHDSLDYFSKDPVFRRYHHDRLTFSLWYAFSENFVLPLSHDEVVYGKRSLLSKMPGDEWQRYANLRLLLGWMWMHPGKKLLFMGGEFGQSTEWNHDAALDWAAAESPAGSALRRWVGDLNRACRAEAALHELDFTSDGFEWVDARDIEASVLSFLRKGREGTSPLLVVCNFTPVVRHGYDIGVPEGGVWREVLNSDAHHYGGSGVGNFGAVSAQTVPAHGRAQSLRLTLPPLGMLVLKPDLPAATAAPALPEAA
jgi:1,4-alpha-glucan branching enzyme